MLPAAACTPLHYQPAHIAQATTHTLQASQHAQLSLACPLLSYNPLFAVFEGLTVLFGILRTTLPPLREGAITTDEAAPNHRRDQNNRETLLANP